MNDKLTKLTEVLEDFRSLYPEMPVQTMLVLLLVAKKSDGIPVLKIGETLGIAASSATRNVDVLGRGQVGKKGLDLVETVPNPTDRREKLVLLTRKGQRVVESLITKL